MEFTAPKDLGFDETFERFNGKFLDETSYDTVVSSIGAEDRSSVDEQGMPSDARAGNSSVET